METTDNNSSPYALFIILFFYLTIAGLLITSRWKVFVKAGKPGWACIVPIYSLVVLLEIIKKPTSWIIFMFLPIVSIVYLIKMDIELAKVFGKSSGFGIGLVFLPFVFYPILAFGDAVYENDNLDFANFGKPVEDSNFEK